MSTSAIVHALLSVKNCTAELYLNDVPISRLTPVGLAAEGRAVEQYLIPGANRLELLVEPGARPSETRSGARNLTPAAPPAEAPETISSDAEASALIVRVPVGDDIDSPAAQRLGEVRFKCVDLQGQTSVFPQSLIADFDAGPAHGRWDWQDAPILSAGAELFDEARKVLDEIADIFRRKSGQLYYSVTEIQCRDASRAYPAWDDATIRKELDEQAQMYASVPDPIVPVDPERNDFRLVAGGRMIQCLDIDWTTSLKLRSKRGTLVPHPVLLARVGGRLRVVR